MPPLSPEAARTLLDRQAEEVLEFERRADRELVGPLRAVLREITVEAARRWAREAGALDRTPDPRVLPALTVFLLGLFGRVKLVELDLTDLALAAMRLGVKHAGQHVDLDITPAPRRLPADLRALVDAAPLAKVEQVETAERVIRAGRLDPAMRDTAMALAHRSAIRAESAVTTVVQRGVSAGVAEAARANGHSTVWRVERDACLHCLAYAGKVDRGSGFPAGLTYADAPLKLAAGRAVVGPPLHPRCRCQLAPWNDAWTSGATSLPEALEREARRSVALGFALPSESDAARQRAADRLLQAGAGLPRTVEERAARAIQTRRPFKRPVP